MEKLSIDWTGDIAEIQVDPCRNAVIVLHSDNLGIIVPHIQAYFFSRLTALYCLDTVSHFLADSVYGFIADI